MKLMYLSWGLMLSFLTACEISEIDGIQLDRSETVAGIDADKNGIRDDVEHYIEQTYTQPAQRAAVVQFAKEFQASLLLDHSIQLPVRNSSRQKSRAIGCIYERFPSGQKPAAYTVVNDLIAVFTNTKPRLKAYIAFNKAMDGTAMQLPTEDLCDS